MNYLVIERLGLPPLVPNLGTRVRRDPPSNPQHLATLPAATLLPEVLTLTILLSMHDYQRQSLPVTGCDNKLQPG
jgi:hypothetical protein